MPCEATHVGILTEADLASYCPKDDKSHLRLGISTEGMLRFLDKLKFIQSSGGSKNFTDATEWVYSNTYVRSAAISWVNDIVGTPEDLIVQAWSVHVL